MNRVGEKGEGESVWLGWFLHAALTAFVPLALARIETGRAEIWTAHADALKVAIEREAWDGEWYRRGYFDDGAPLGSATNDECQIDFIAQSWAVLSSAATPDRAARAMAALDRQLIWREDGLALLFAPPFDKTTHDPGYIKGYPPGVRENGGQYTHAATWSVMAFAALGEGDKAAKLSRCSTPSTIREPAPTRIATKSSPMSYARTYTQRRPTSDAAAGPGIRVRPAGCSARGREPARSAAPRSVLVCRSLHPQGLGQVRGDAELSNRAILDFRREPERG